MIRRPPRSTLFPTRRSSDLEVSIDKEGLLLEINKRWLEGAKGAQLVITSRYDLRNIFTWNAFLSLELLPLRSEEHTSELQSRQYLVCRLLLEKKNYKIYQYN